MLTLSAAKYFGPSMVGVFVVVVVLPRVVFRIFWVKCCLGLDEAAGADAAAAAAAADVAALLFYFFFWNRNEISSNMCVRLLCVCVSECVLLLFGSSSPFARIFLPVLFAPGLAFFAYHHHPSKVCFCFLLGSPCAPFGCCLFSCIFGVQKPTHHFYTRTTSTHPPPRPVAIP